MESSYEYIISNGHHLVVIDGLTFVVDTGSPISFSFNSEIKKISINGSVFPLKKNISGVNHKKLTELVGMNVDGFIGTDLLLLLENIVFDKVNKKITFHSELSSNGKQIPISVMSLQGMGIISIPLKVNGIDTLSIFDTGAWIGYVSGKLLDGCENLGEVTDYSPSFGGHIKTSKYRVSIEVANLSTEMIVGKMTPTLELTLGLLNYGMIFGLNDLPSERVKLDLRQQEIVLMDEFERTLYSD